MAGSVLFCVLLLRGTFAMASPIDLLLIGDSITLGCVSFPAGTNCSCIQGLCYAERLKTILDDDYQIHNAGVGGATSFDWVPGAVGFPNILVDGTPTGLFEGLIVPNLTDGIVLIMLGVNDAVGFFELGPTKPEDYRRNLSEMLSDVFMLGADRVILVKPTPLSSLDITGQNRIRRYGLEIDALCALTENVFCGPDLASLLTSDDFHPGDVHPNATGHMKIAAAVANSIALVPEPSVALLMALGLAALGSRKISGLNVYEGGIVYRPVARGLGVELREHPVAEGIA